MSRRDRSRSHSKQKVRYGVVGLGWFAQSAVLPAFDNARRNSELAALFSSDSRKREELKRRHGVERAHPYEALEDAIAGGDLDAVYVVLPNHLHASYTIRAARAGAHVLCEKPMAVREEECREMIEAAREHGVKLMIAYRLHYAEANLEAIRSIESGRIGEPRLFEAVFANAVADPGNIRLDPLAKGGGTVYDIGIYCINAARHIFGDEPIEVAALSASRQGDPRFADCDETTAGILRFPGERLATFSSTFGTADADGYRVLGTEGILRVEPAFQLRAALKHVLTAGGRTEEREFPPRDQVAPEILAFSDAILENRDPAPPGREGLADVRVIEALQRSAREGRAVALPELPPPEGPRPEPETRRPPVGEQKLVNARPPGEE